MHRTKIVYALLAMLLLVACQSVDAAQASNAAALPDTAAEVPRMRVKELNELLDAGEEVIVVDTRLRASYDESHIVGAISLPLLEVDDRYKELPKNAKIVLYCT
jgi:hypothetical protein